MNKELTAASVARYSVAFDSDVAARVAMNAIVKHGLSAAAGYDTARRSQNVYSIEVTDSGKITNQKASGRCWMFAALNAMRTDAIRKYNLETMEFSQAYPLFYDKLERCNYFLECVISTLSEPLNSRLVQHLLDSPLGDGGQWDMFKSIVKKYGVVPKAAMPESYHSSNTAQMNKFLTLKLREFACALRGSTGKNEDELRAMKDGMMSTVYHMLCVCLGKPPAEVVFEARDKDKKFVRVGPMSPTEFFKEAVGWELDDKVSLINAPTADKPYGQTYTIDYLGNVWEGDPIKYLNLPSEQLKAAVVSQLKDNRPVWFGCDVGQWLDRDLGVMDMHSSDFASALGTEFPMTKAQRLDYGESRMTHAMVFYGADLDDDGTVIRFKVANSWGDDRGQEGWYVMSGDWFDEYLYQVLVDVKYLTDEQREALNKPVAHLDPWDPMGALAR